MNFLTYISLCLCRADYQYRIEEVSELNKSYEAIMEDQSMPGHLLMFDMYTTLERMSLEGVVTYLMTLSHATRYVLLKTLR